MDICVVLGRSKTERQKTWFGRFLVDAQTHCHYLVCVWGFSGMSALWVWWVFVAPIHVSGVESVVVSVMLNGMEWER